MAAPGGAVLRGLGDELPWHDRSIDLVVLTHPQADHVHGLLDVLEPLRRATRARRPRRQTGRRRSTPGSTRCAPRRRRRRDRACRDRRSISAMARGSTCSVRTQPMAADPQLNNTRRRHAPHLARRQLPARPPTSRRGPNARCSTDGVDLRATVLKVAHHGSRTSSTPAFLDAVQPQVAVDLRRARTTASAIRRRTSSTALERLRRRVQHGRLLARSTSRRTARASGSHTSR